MIDLPDTESRVQAIPTDAEAQRILDALVSAPSKYCVYYLLAIYTGCRRGELCALKWTDFEMSDDLQTSVLTVSRSRSIVAGKGVQEGLTKNKKPRTIFIDEALNEFVIYLCMEEDQRAIKAGRKLGEYMFTNDNFEPVHPDTFSICANSMTKTDSRRTFICILCGTTAFLQCSTAA